MFRLGFRLTLRSGKEAFVRLLLTTVAVAVGVIVLLSVLALYSGYQKTSNRPSWESTSAIQTSSNTNASNLELWNYSENIFKGQFIEQLGIARLGVNSPIPPGISSLPSAGQYYVSPALAALIKSVPADELGDRFPGKQIGIIGQSALAGPKSLVIYIGYTPTALRSLPGTITINQISTGIELEGTTNIYRLAFKIATVAILFPILIFINTTTRLAASRREERYSALRLIGATPSQINIIATVEAFIGAVLGTVLGILIFLIVKPVVANASLSGFRFFANYVTPPVYDYISIFIIVPIAAVIASVFSLRRVQVSPLGVSHKVTPKAPNAWRILPLLFGIPFFIYSAVSQSSAIKNNSSNFSPGPDLIGLLLIMFGLVIGGSWLTMQATLLLSKLSKGASSLLAARRLADNPKVAFRSVSGLVLAVFLGSAFAVLVPTINAAESPSSSASLTNVLRVSYNFGIPPPAQEQTGQIHTGGKLIQIQNQQNSALQYYGLPPSTSAKLIANLMKIHGTEVIPVYANATYQNIMTCSSLKQLPILGSCEPGLKYVGAANMQQLLDTDNPLYVNKALPIVSGGSQGTTGNLSDLSLEAMLIKTNNLNTLEQVRTYLTNFNASNLQSGGSGLSGWQMGQLEPETFGEIAQIRNNDDSNVEHIIFAITGVTILIAGCSLAVNTGGSIVERKRPFTLLQLSGVSIGALNKVIILEAVLPLITVSIVAALVGIAVAVPVIGALVPNGVHVLYPSLEYYVVMILGLFIALLIILTTLPLLQRLTKPENARFE